MHTINIGEIEKIHQGIPEIPGKGKVVVVACSLTYEGKKINVLLGLSHCSESESREAYSMCMHVHIAHWMCACLKPGMEQIVLPGIM